MIQFLFSLFLWEQMEATKTIYYSLWLMFLASCILPTNTFLTLIGLFCVYGVNGVIEIF